MNSSPLKYLHKYGDALATWPCNICRLSNGEKLLMVAFKDELIQYMPIIWLQKMIFFNKWALKILKEK